MVSQDLLVPETRGKYKQRAAGSLYCLCREGYGVAPIVKMLEVSKNVAVTGAAADAIRAIALNNDANKNAVREAWALPLLVKMLGPDVGLLHSVPISEITWQAFRPML